MAGSHNAGCSTVDLVADCFLDYGRIDEGRVSMCMPRRTTARTILDGRAPLCSCLAHSAVHARKRWSPGTLRLWRVCERATERQDADQQPAENVFHQP